MFYFSDLGSVVHHEIIQKIWKSATFKNWFVSLTTPSKWVWLCEHREYNRCCVLREHQPFSQCCLSYSVWLQWGLLRQRACQKSLGLIACCHFCLYCYTCPQRRAISYEITPQDVLLWHFGTVCSSKLTSVASSAPPRSIVFKPLT